MDIISTILSSYGLSSLIPVVLSTIGLASSIATIYPPNWRGAKAIHVCALLLGRAAPLDPAKRT